MTQNQQGIVGDEAEYPRYRWVVLGLLMLTQEIAMLFTGGGIGILLPVLRKELGFGMAEAGLLSSLSSLPRAILSVPLSLLLVRFSPKRVYLAVLVFIAVAGFFIGRAPAFVFLAAAYLFLGSALAIREIPDTLLRAQWIPKKQLTTVMGITMGMMAMGQSVGIMVIPFLLTILGNWRNMLSVYSLVMLLMSIIWMVFAREHVMSKYPDGMSSRADRPSLRSVLKRKEFTMIGIAIFGNALTYTCTLLFLPTYLVEQRGLALTTAGLISGLLPLGGISANFVMGFISDRIGLRKPTIWPAALLEPILYFILLSPIPSWALPVIAFVVGFMAWAPFTAVRSIPYELPGVKPAEVAVGQSVINTITTLGMFFGAPSVGRLAEKLGSMGTALSIVCVFPLTMAVVGFLLPETGRNARLKQERKVTEIR